MYFIFNISFITIYIFYQLVKKQLLNNNYAITSKKCSNYAVIFYNR